MGGVKSPHAEMKEARRKRLENVIKTEGKSLTTNALRIRFPWAGRGLINKLRKKFDAPPPSESGMLSTKDMANAAPAKCDRFGSKGNGQ